MTYLSALERAPVRALKPNRKNARKHSKQQVKQIAASIERFGFNNPILVDDAFGVLAGHGRLEAAKLLGMVEVPVIKLSHLSAPEKRAYMIADNRLAEKAGWDKAILAVEFQDLIDLGFDVELTGFDTGEIDLILDEVGEADPDGPGPEDLVPPTSPTTVSQVGDMWVLGRHRLVCGDAREPASYAALMRGEQAHLVFTDPPYNVQISGNASPSGAHGEFIMGSGELSPAAFEDFLVASLGETAKNCRDGAIAFICMDWRHMDAVSAAGRRVFSSLKNLVVWSKTNAGMGSFYRSQHELVFVFKVGEGAHTNTFELGQHGRYRTNVWSYPGVNAFGATREQDLALHPTVKPAAMVADAIKDVSKRGQIVLDPFGGSGSTLIAAETCGRSARLIELDRAYCDVIVRRYERFSGKPGVLEASGETFAQAAERRGAERPAGPSAETAHESSAGPSAGSDTSAHASLAGEAHDG